MAVHGKTGCATGQCRGGDAITTYSAVRPFGALSTTAPTTEPGDLRKADLAACIKQVAGRQVLLRDVALANDVAWIDSGFRGSLDGTFTPPPAGHRTIEKRGDLLLVTLGDAGIFVFDVSDRTVQASNLIGLLRVNQHSAHRLEVDSVRGLLFAGGSDPELGSIIDAWDLAAVNGAPGQMVAPQPVLTIAAPWTTNHLGLDPLGTGLLTTWGDSRGPLAVPFAAPRFVFSGLYLPEAKDMPLDSERRPQAVERISGVFVPLGVPMRIKRAADEQQREDDRDADERAGTAALKLRLALPGSFGPELTAKVQSLRTLPGASLLVKADVGAAAAAPGGEAWPDPEVIVHLRRVGVGSGEPDAGDLPAGEAGRFATAYNLYESVETVLLLADPRARRTYHLQQLPEGARPNDHNDLDEAGACRRCVWPRYLPDPKGDEPDENDELDRIVELLAGGEHLRAYLSPDPEGDAEVRNATELAIASFEARNETYPAPTGVARVAAWADAVPSPIQASLAEPAQNPAYWSPGEAGVSVSLASGDALLSASDRTWSGRMLAVSLDRTYRSGTLGYGPLGAAGWHWSLGAHLREIGTTGEVEYHDGAGSVYRFYPNGGDKPSDDWDDDAQGSYHVPAGLYVRLRKLDGGQGWQLIGRNHDVLRFDAAGRLTELSDRLRQNKPATEQGNTIRYSYDEFGQLTGIEDDLGRRYRLEYYDDPKPESEGGDGPRYGLLKKVTDWVDRSIEYAFDDERRLTQVTLPEVTNPIAEYSQYGFTGSNRPAIEYRYGPQDNVSSEETAAHAILHGQFAALRLEGFEQPGSDVLRARFEYDFTTGRARAVAFPDQQDHNTAGSGVAWTISYPSEPGDAAPPTAATVTAPWLHEVDYTLEHGRIAAVEQQIGVAQPDGTIAAQPVRVAYAYSEDGRLTTVTLPDGGERAQCYADGAGCATAPSQPDRLARANVVTSTVRATTPLAQGSAPYTEAASSAAYQDDNLPYQLVDGRGRAVDLAVPAPNRDGTQSFRAEGVSTSFSYESFGRPTRSTGGGDGGPVTSFTYGVDRKGRAGAGLLQRAEQGQGAMAAEIERDDADNVRSATASSGSRSELEHDTWDRPVRIVDGLGSGAGVPPAGTLVAPGRRLERAFDAAGRVVAERRLQDYADADGTLRARWVEARYEYNERDQFVAVERSHVASPLAAGVAIPVLTRVAEREYDEHGRLAEDRLLNLAGAPRATHYTYDAAGRVAGERTGVGGERRFGYDLLARLSLRTDGDASTWFARHDAWGRRWSELEPTGAVVRRFFDQAGNVTMEERWDGDPAAGGGTLLARQEAEITSFGAVARAATHLRAGAGGSEVLLVERQFDPAGRAIATWSGPAGPDGRLQQTSARRESEVAYEPLAGRVVTEATGGAWGEEPVQRTSYLYSPDSKASWPDAITTWESVPGQSGLVATTTVSYAHDAAGHVLAEAWSDGRTFVHDYDRSGDRIRTRDGAGTLTASSLDGRGRLLRAIRPQGRGSTAYAYDLDGRLLLQQVATADGTWDTAHEYDLSGRRTRTEHPDGTTETFAYNADDTVASWTTRDGVGVGYTYDEANRVIAAVPSLVVGAVLSAGMAPLDGGDAFAYDRMSRLLQAAQRTTAGTPDPASLVALSGYDLAGNPAAERVGARDVMGFRYDPWSRPVGLDLPAALMADSAAPLAGFTRTYSATDQLTAVAASGGPAGLGASWTWGGRDRLYGVATVGPLALAERYGYLGGAGVQPCGGGDSDTPWRLGAIAVGPAGGTAATAPPAAEWGRLGLGWRPGDGAKLSRSASSACGGLFSGMGWEWQLDAGVRVTGADGLDRFTFTYGTGDELLAAVQDGAGAAPRLDIGPEGRIAARDGAAFAYLPSGRRLADDRHAYTWDWRGRLVAVTVNTTWPSPVPGGEPVVPPFAGHQVRYEHDGLGRLLARTHLGPLPEGATDDAQRPFIERRSFVWEGNALRAELAHGAADGSLLRWRRTYLPGPTGLDDAVQVRVERFDPAGSALPSSDVVYTIVRDELGSVVGLVDEAAVADPSQPALLARYHYTPYGEAHAETGPELLEARFDESLTSLELPAGPVEQTLAGDAAPGGVRVRLTLPADASTLAGGILLERYDPASGWLPLAPAERVLASSPARPEELLLLPLSGWQPGATYRLRLTSQLTDLLGRPLVQADAFSWTIPPTEPDQPPQPASFHVRRSLTYDSATAAWSTVDRAFPGGQPLLFHGLWHDPVTGLGYARARWYDARNASWLSEDPAQDIDSPNLYAYVAWQPHMATDPMGLAEIQQGFTNAYQAASAEAASPRNRLWQRVVFGTLALAVAPAAGVEQFANAVVDTPERMWRSSRGVVQESQAAITANEGEDRLGHAVAAWGHGGQLILDAAIVEGAAGKAMLSFAEKRAFRAVRAAPGDVAITSQETAAFGSVTATTSEEAALLRNAQATFGEGSVYSSATRFEGNIVVQRSDIPWSLQNVTRMAGGNTPFVKNAAGEWEKVNLHHVGRQEGKLIEVLRSQNVYTRTGGPLHIPGPGSPVRSQTFGASYWQQRLQAAIDEGLVDPTILRQAGLGN